MLVMDREAEAIMAERFGKDAVIALATVADGVPHVRYVDAYYQAGAFYIVDGQPLAENGPDTAKSPGGCGGGMVHRPRARRGSGPL